LQWAVPRELLWAIIFTLAVFVVGLWPSHYPYSQAPKIDAQQQAKDSVGGQDTPSHTPSAQIDAAGSQQNQHRGENAPETTVLGIKPGEWLLGIVTWMLWFATFRLVKGADETSKRQLRAYLSMNPKIFSNFVTGGFVRIEFLQKNHGQTPAFNITHVFEIAILPNPLPKGFVFPAPTWKVDTNHTVFPASDAKAWFNRGVPLTAADVAMVQASTHKIHIWGVTTYLDAFQRTQTTKFSAGVGGPDFVQSQLLAQSGNLNGPPWIWEFESEHNHAT